MAVHAHPDDESSKGAATTARYAADGHRVLVVTLTGGERGDILNPAMDLPEVHGRMAEIRRDEMAKAAEILGVEHTWLGFVDSGLPEGDPPAAAARRMFPGWCPRATHRSAGTGDPRVQTARRLTTRTAATRIPITSAATRCRSRPTKRPATQQVPRRRRAVERPSCTTTTASCGNACSCCRTSSPSTARGPVREVAQALGPRTRRVRRPGDHPRRMLRVLRAA